MVSTAIQITVESRQRVLAKELGGERRTSEAEIRLDDLELHTLTLFDELIRRGALDDRAHFEVVGTHLFRSIFVGDVRSLFLDAHEQVRKSGGRLRVHLVFGPDADDLRQLPWEYIYIPGGRAEGTRPLYFATDVVLARHMDPDDDRDVSLIPEDGPLRVLVAVSEPSDLEPVEADAVLDAVAGLPDEMRIEVQSERRASYEAFSDAIARFDPHVVHFLGHGRFEGSRGWLAFLKEDGTKWWVEDVRFSSAFEDAEKQPRVVFLHLCERARLQESFAGIAPNLIRSQVPAVVAMQHPITNAMAIKFCTAFYGSLSRGDPIDDAVQQGRSSIVRRDPDAYRNRAFGTPVLYMRNRVGGLIKKDRSGTGDAVKTTGPLKGRGSELDAVEARLTRGNGGARATAGLQDSMGTIDLRTGAEQPAHAGGEAARAGREPALVVERKPSSAPDEPTEQVLDRLAQTVERPSETMIDVMARMAREATKRVPS